MLKGLYTRSKRLIVSALVCAAVAVPLLAPKPAQAWWRPGWGWRGGWGWPAGVFVGVPPVVAGPPLYAPAAYPYPYAYPYVAPYAGPAPYWHWVPAYRNAAGVLVEAHWEHR